MQRIELRFIWIVFYNQNKTFLFNVPKHSKKKEFAPSIRNTYKGFHRISKETTRLSKFFSKENIKSEFLFS
jgi:hypothetical protein